MILFHQVHGVPAGVRLVLAGEIDLYVRDELRSVLTWVVAGSSGTIDVDLHDVTFLDCSGIGELVRAYTEACRRGHRLSVSRPRGTVRRVLVRTGVLAVLGPDAADEADTPVAVPAAADAGIIPQSRRQTAGPGVPPDGIRSRPAAALPDGQAPNRIRP